MSEQEVAILGEQIRALRESMTAQDAARAKETQQLRELVILLDTSLRGDGQNGNNPSLLTRLDRLEQSVTNARRWWAIAGAAALTAVVLDLYGLLAGGGPA